MMHNSFKKGVCPHCKWIKRILFFLNSSQERQISVMALLTNSLWSENLFFKSSNRLVSLVICDFLFSYKKDLK